MTLFVRARFVLGLTATLPALAIACDTSKDSAGPEWSIGPVNAMKPLELDPIKSGAQDTTSLAIDAQQLDEPIVNVSIEPNPAIGLADYGDCIGQTTCDVTIVGNAAAPPGDYTALITLDFGNGETSDLEVELRVTASGSTGPTATDETTTEETTNEITTTEPYRGATSTNETETTTGDTQTATDTESPAPPS